MGDTSTSEVCLSCGFIHPRGYMYRREGGWARPRDEGGTHALRLRSVDNSAWVCHGCMEEWIARRAKARPLPPVAVGLIDVEVPGD